MDVSILYHRKGKEKSRLRNEAALDEKLFFNDNGHYGSKHDVGKVCHLFGTVGQEGEGDKIAFSGYECEAVVSNRSVKGIKQRGKIVKISDFHLGYAAFRIESCKAFKIGNV